MDPPGFDDFTISPSTTVETLDDLTVEVHITDAGSSGFESAELWLSDADNLLVSNAARITAAHRISGTAFDGTYSLTFTVPANLSEGTYFWGIRIRDASGISFYRDGKGGEWSVETLAAATLFLSPLPPREAWRQKWFQTILNDGNAADDADPDSDGLDNFLEFATDQNPTEATTSPGTITKQGSDLKFTFSRSVAGTSDGVSYSAEWSDTLTGTWSTTGVISSAISSTPTAEQILTTIPAGTGNKRFVRLKVSK